MRFLSHVTFSVRKYRTSRFKTSSTGTHAVRSTKYAARTYEVLSLSKFVTVHNSKAYGGVEVQRQVEVSRQVHAPAISHSAETPGTRLIGGWLGARTGLERLGENKNRLCSL